MLTGNRADAKNFKGDKAGACEDLKASASLGDIKAKKLLDDHYCD
jgi:hypothetical protein